MMREAVSEGGLRPLVFVPGCNTEPEISRAQLSINIERDLPWFDVEPLKNKPLAIVAGGPSLRERLPELLSFAIATDADVLALNGAYGFLRAHGIDPTYWMLLDARRDNIDFLKDVCPDTRHFVAAQCHPDVFDRLEGSSTTLYLTTMPDIAPLVRHIDKPKLQLNATVGTVGMKALSLAFGLGYRELHLFGYDSSYTDTHHAFPQPLNDSSKTIDVYIGDRRYTTTPSYAHQAAEFCGFAKDLVGAHGCSIELHCDGLLPDVVAIANTLGDVPLEIREREKYEEMWTHDAYRRDAPGAAFVDEAVDALGIQQGDSLIDFGAGTGRASFIFHEFKGLDVTAVDFVPAAFEYATGCIKFVQACLWELPESLSADWGYCTDVMEHIPPEKVEDVVAGIASRIKRGVYFNIATRPDNLGARIGRKLHMTVMEAHSWRAILSKYFAQVETQVREGEATFICKR